MNLDVLAYLSLGSVSALFCPLSIFNWLTHCYLGVPPELRNQHWMTRKKRGHVFIGDDIS